MNMFNKENMEVSEVGRTSWAEKDLAEELEEPGDPSLVSQSRQTAVALLPQNAEESLNKT